MNIDFAQGDQLGQRAPVAAGVFETLVTGLGVGQPAIEVVTLYVTNTTGSAATFSICHDNDGAVYTVFTSLYWQVSIPANTTTVLRAEHVGGGIFVGANGSIGVTASAANGVNFTAYGVSERVVARTVMGQL